MKLRFISLILALTLALSLPACSVSGNNESNISQSDGSNNRSSSIRSGEISSSYAPKANPASDFEYDIPDGINVRISKYIGDKTDVVIPAEIEGSSQIWLYNSPFSHIKEGNLTVTIPSNINMSNFAFRDCTALKSVTILDGMTSLGGGTFENCTSLTDVTLPDSITYMSSAFAGCTSLKKIRIPENATNLDRAFKESGLESVIIPSSVVNTESAFRNCKSLTSVMFSDGVVEIDDYAFYNCPLDKESKQRILEINPNANFGDF